MGQQVGLTEAVRASLSVSSRQDRGLVLTGPHPVRAPGVAAATLSSLPFFFVLGGFIYFVPVAFTHHSTNFDRETQKLGHPQNN